MVLRFALVGVIALFSSLVFFVLSGAIAAASAYTLLVEDLPAPEEIREQGQETFETTRIYDRTGETVLYELIPETYGRRTWVPLTEIPEYLRNATIAMEDKTFYDTRPWINFYGINVEGMGRAVWGQLSGSSLGGGSSISQQLVRNVIMDEGERAEQSYVRKLKEMVLTVELSRRYPGSAGRDLVLEMYLNNIFYGRMAYGVEAAAQTYFGKSVRDLTLAEAAMIVPLGRRPLWNPIDNPDTAKQYQRVVLEEMARQGYITPEEAEEAKREDILVARQRFDIVSPHFVNYVREELLQDVSDEDLYRGLKVITSIDLEVQDKALEIAREHIDTLRDSSNAHNAAVVVIDAKTAEVIAMVGSLDYWDESISGSINMATSPRQPGSSIKPFTYATAFMQGYTPATMVMDVRTSFPDPPSDKPYVPENYSRTFHGPMLLRRALACSYNIPAVAMMQKVGAMNVVDTAHRMGITTLNEPTYGLSLTLGGGEVKLLDMVYAFGVFANGGEMLGQQVPSERYQTGMRSLEPITILKVTTADGEVIRDYEAPQRRQVISPQVSYLITDILSDNRARSAAFGSESVLKLSERPAAAKTGTTNDYHDGWTVGYTPQYITGVWVGNANYEQMKNASGVRAAGPIWHNVMEYLHEGLPVEEFQQPEGIVTAVVDGISGKLPTDNSPWRTQEIFVEGTVPTEEDDVHKVFRICRASGKLATIYCPESEVEKQVFEVYPAGADDWVREQELPQPPTEFCDTHGPSPAKYDVAIVNPTLFQIVRGQVPIIGNVKPGGLQQWHLEYGAGFEPESYARVGPDRGHRVDNGLLETWDTEALGVEGLQTLKLSVVDGGVVRDASIQVIIDNISPTVSILNPSPMPEKPEDVTYEIGKDEWVNIQVYATDNTAMDRVEFFLDDKSIGFTTVAPYTLRWTLGISNTRPSYSFAAESGEEVLGDRVTTTEVTTTTNGLKYTRTVRQGEDVSVTEVISDSEQVSYRISMPNGKTVRGDSHGYTETHTIHVVAYDSVGNEMKSEPTYAHVIPKQKEEAEDPRLARP